MNTLLEFGQLFMTLCIFLGVAAILSFAVVLCCFIVTEHKEKLHKAYLDSQREGAKIYQFEQKED